MRIQKLNSDTKKNLLEDLLKRSPNNYGQYEASVKEILDKVKEEKDAAVFAYTAKFDGAELTADTIEVTDAEIEEAYAQVDDTPVSYTHLAKTDHEKRGRLYAIYFLENSLFPQDNEKELFEKWSEKEEWKSFEKICTALWNDIRYFPVPESPKHPQYQVSFVDSWMGERTYGGKRGHEGCDLMASKDIPGLYPVVSMTDGVVSARGWLEKGGYRIGITAPSGAYFYYAHLDSYGSYQEGDEVKAGDIIGFMGNTGYGPEGTKGMFATHLHLGIYLYPDGEETSYNPYWILRLAGEKKLSCSF